MYLDFFGFSTTPFELTPDPRFLYLPRGHQEALSMLQYGVMSGKGLTVLTGEAGLGKTTILKAALGQLHGVANRVITISNPALTRAEFIEVIARSLNATELIGSSKPAVLVALENALVRDHENGMRTVLIADEAHVMPNELLEEIRLLGNFETATAKLLSIILVGQPELAGRLNEPSLRQLKQRVALRSWLVPFTAGETAAYIDTRLRVAGRPGSEVFSAEAVDKVHSFSRGIPRVINVLCDNALLTAFAADQRMVNASVIEEVGKDFDLEGDAPEPQATAEPVPPPIASVPAAPVVEALAAATAVSENAPIKRPSAPPPTPPRRPHPDAPHRALHPPAPAPAEKESSSLFKIYGRRKGFFSRVFS